MKLIYSHTEAFAALTIVQKITADVLYDASTTLTEAEYLAHLATQPFTVVTADSIIVDIPEDKVLLVMSAIGEFSSTLGHIVKALMSLAELFKDAGKRFERRINELLS